MSHPQELNLSTHTVDAPGAVLTYDVHEPATTSERRPLSIFGSPMAASAPDPARFGLATEDDGSRDDALLSRNLRIPPFEPDLDALRSSTVRIVPAIGAEGEGTLARRGGPMPPDNDPAAFAVMLREVLDGA